MSRFSVMIDVIPSTSHGIPNRPAKKEKEKHLEKQNKTKQKKNCTNSVSGHMFAVPKSNFTVQHRANSLSLQIRLKTALK